MNPMDILELIGETEDFYVMDAAENAFRVKRVRTITKKLWIFAAILAAMVIFMGCMWIVRITTATTPDYPVVENSQIGREIVHISASEVNATGMHVTVQMDGFDSGPGRAVIMLRPGPFVLERKTEDGWVALSPLVSDPDWNSDEVWTDGYLDWYVNWTTVYGILDSGTYRYVFDLLEGHEAFCCEFTVTPDTGNVAAKALRDVLNSDAYCVRLITESEFDSLDSLSDSDREALINRNACWVYEYWKSGDDLLHLVYRNDVLWVGMMYRDGEKYTLDHEGDNRNNPITGWSFWPDMDLNRLTEWANLLMEDSEGWEVNLDAGGALVSLRRIGEPRRDDKYPVDVTAVESWEFLTGDSAGSAAKIAGQDVDTVQSFSWQEDQEQMKALDVAFVNTTAQPVTTASEAIARALTECTVEHDKIVVYRDADAGMWKVEFQILYGYQGYGFVYLDDNGITRMVSAAGSKVYEFQQYYPGP